MIGTVLKAALLVLCLVCSLVACSEDTPDRGRTQKPVTAQKGSATPGAGTSAPTESTAVESTVGNLVFRRDEAVLQIDRAELLTSKGGDEVFVEATPNGSPGREGCFLIEQKARDAFREAIRSGDPSVMKKVRETSWTTALWSQKYSSRHTLAVSFREDPSRSDEANGPRNTPFYALCFNDAGRPSTGWYDIAHVEGTPEAQ